MKLNIYEIAKYHCFGKQMLLLRNVSMSIQNRETTCPRLTFMTNTVMKTSAKALVKIYLYYKNMIFEFVTVGD